MTLYEQCRALMKEAIRVFKKLGYTKEDLEGGIEEAQKVFKMMNLKTDIKSLLTKVTEDSKKDI